MGYKLAAFIFGMICLSAVQPAPVLEEVGAPSPTEKTEEEKASAILHAYSKSNDTESTYEEIMEEIAARKAEQSGANAEAAHTITKR